MIYLKVSKERVEDLFKTVVTKKKKPHKLFQRTKNYRWMIRKDGSVKAVSVLWFFCWAFNGDHSPSAQIACEEIWKEIMPFSFSFFNEIVGYEYAHRFRYSQDEEFIEKELEALLAQKGRNKVERL